MHFNSDKYHFGSPPPDSMLESDEERFSYRGTSSSGDETGDEDQTVMVHFFKKIYKDPHQDTMEKLDGHAADVLRTGKITVAGNAGGGFAAKIGCMHRRCYILYVVASFG